MSNQLIGVSAPSTLSYGVCHVTYTTTDGCDLQSGVDNRTESSDQLCGIRLRIVEMAHPTVSTSDGCQRVRKRLNVIGCKPFLQREERTAPDSEFSWGRIDGSVEKIVDLTLNSITTSSSPVAGDLSKLSIPSAARSIAAVDDPPPSHRVRNTSQMSPLPQLEGIDGDSGPVPFGQGLVSDVARLH